MMSTANLTGEEIADIAYEQPSIKTAGMGIAIEVLLYIFTVLCAVVIGLRVWVKTWREETSRPWKINDYLAVIGFLPFIPATVFGVLAVRYGVGATDSYLDQFPAHEFIRVRGMEYLLLYEILYYAASSITKYAIAFTILHICVQKRYIYLMWAIMVVMGITMAGCLIWLFANCRPFAAYWNEKLGKCKTSPTSGFLVISYIGTAVQVLTDWTCAITPFFIVWSLQMPRRAKISVVVVLGLGVLASVAALMRIISYQYIDIRAYPKDHMISQGRLLLWSIFESSFAIIACSLPPLKKLLSNFLDRSLGRSTGPSEARNGYTSDTPLHSLSLTPHVKGQTRTTVSGRAKWDRLQDDDSSARHIVQETEVHIETASNRSGPQTPRSGAARG